MARRLLSFLITLSMCGYALGVLNAHAVSLSSPDHAHCLMHLEAEGHHHHEDGSWHADDSAEAVQHAICDHLSSPAALLSTAAIPVVLPPSVAPAERLSDGASPPHPDNLLRPPRSI